MAEESDVLAGIGITSMICFLVFLVLVCGEVIGQRRAASVAGFMGHPDVAAAIKGLP